MTKARHNGAAGNLLLRGAIFSALILPAALCPGRSLSAVSLEPVFSDGFEEGLDRWNPLWTRVPKAGSLWIDSSGPRFGKTCVAIEHTDAPDWSFTPRLSFEGKLGDLWEMECWVNVKGEGRTEICAVLYDSDGRAIEWTYGGKGTGETGAWKKLSSRIVIPGGTATVVPRLIGTGPALVLMDDFAFRKKGNILSMMPSGKSETELESAALKVTFVSPDGTLDVTDKRTGRTWTQKVLHPGMIVNSVKKARGGRSARLDMVHASSGLKIQGKVDLDSRLPELVVSLSASGDMPENVYFPAAFVSKSGERLVLPVNEGISYPVDDKTIEEQWYHTYGGHGLCMGFWGSTTDSEGWMAIVETADDAEVHVGRIDGNLAIAPVWHPEKGKLGYERRLRYVFFDSGGHVAMCKRYRKHAEKEGLVKTLTQKRKANADVDLLVGSVNVWTWEENAAEIAREMQSLGIDRILWSHRGSPESIRTMNEMGGILTSRYDIYQDLMDPSKLKFLRGTHPDWTQEAWPNDIMVGPDGQPLSGWAVRGLDGKMHPCAVLCDALAPKYARLRISEELKTHPYHSRFIDTTTATSWRECYDKKHPLTRRQSRKAKMKLLDVVSREMKLVCGSETGHDAAVPYVDYFEGMLSLGPFRVPDSGRNMVKLWDEVPERVAKFQMGEGYRLPLWELVYHDCVVSTWYWGDYNNKLPSLWDKRDLFNILYGTPPMFMFDSAIWDKYRDRFVKSYRDVCPVARKVGYAEMTDHRVLTPDRAVQETKFSDGTTITVNFGNKPFDLGGGVTVSPMGFSVRSM